MNSKNEYPKLMEVSNDDFNTFINRVVLFNENNTFITSQHNCINDYKQTPYSEIKLWCFNFAREIYPYRELKEAYKQGKIIQFDNTVYGWGDVKYPNFDYEPSRYRIKPEYIPFDFSDAEKLIGKAVKSNENDLVAIITAIYIDNVITVGDFQRTFDNLLTDFTFLDGSICGKLKNE